MCGPIRTIFTGGAKHLVVFIDDFLRKVWLYVLKSKGDCFKKFKVFKALVETQPEHKIKTFWSENGGKSVSKDAKNTKCFFVGYCDGTIG